MSRRTFSIFNSRSSIFVIRLPSSSWASCASHTSVINALMSSSIMAAKLKQISSAGKENKRKAHVA